jgi:hypothetical protein
MRDDEFTPRLGKPRGTGVRSSFRNQILREVARAGGLDGARSSVPRDAHRTRR